MRILVIDDEENWRIDIANRLKALGHKAWTACSGKEGLEFLRQNPDLINVVITDYRMPVMSGEEVVRAIKQFMPLVRIILTNAEWRFEIRKMGLDAGASAVLFKPFKDEELKSVLS